MPRRACCGGRLGHDARRLKSLGTVALPRPCRPPPGGRKADRGISQERLLLRVLPWATNPASGIESALRALSDCGGAFETRWRRARLQRDPPNPLASARDLDLHTRQICL